MDSDELKELHLRIIDLSARVGKQGVADRIWETIKMKWYETVLFVIVMFTIVISHTVLNADIEKQVVIASVKNANAIKQQVKMYHDELYIGGR